jgi:PKHD-type hydroxylase
MTVATTRIGSDYEFESEQEDWFQQLELIYAYDFLSDEECDVLISLNKIYQPQQAQVEGNELNIEYRNVKEIPLQQMGSKISWLTDRIQIAVNDFNNQFFRFDLLGLDGLQLLSYSSSESSQYRAHQDCIWNDGLMRKLTVVIQLSDPMTYQDGDTVVIDGEDQVPLKKARGSINVFPSFLNHLVKPITNGTRHCIVTWVVGPPFK